MAVNKLLDPSTLFLIRWPPVFKVPFLCSRLSTQISLSLSLMASESTTTESEMSSSAFEQLRSGLSLVPLLIGLMRPSPGSEADRVVLVNPVTQGMIVFHGDAATITEILGGGAGRSGAPPASKASIEAMRSVGGAARNGGGVLGMLGWAGGGGEGDALQAPVPWGVHREVAEDARVVPSV